MRHVVLGIGLDVNVDPTTLPASLREVATSLQAELGAPWIARP